MLVAVIYSCDAWFEKELPKRQISAETVIVDQATAETALLGVYSYLGGYGVFSVYYLVDDAYRLGMLQGTYRGQNFERYLELMSIPSEHDELLTKWTTCSKMINAANHVLNSIDKVGDTHFVGNRKKEIIAEARFLRAFAQLYLMKHYAFFWDIDSEFGPLMRREPSTLENNSIKRSTVRDAYRMILEDLDYAINEAPDYKDAFRVSKGLAKGFKIEVLLLRGEDEDYSLVPQLADEVINDYGFALEKTFEDVFKNSYGSSEMMFSRYLSEKVLTDVDRNVSSIKKLMCGKYQPTEQYYSIFNAENDNRFQYTFDSTMYESINSKVKTLILKKLWREDGNCPMFYMRLAQIYLFKAEALAYNGATVGQVLEPLNKLRERSGNDVLKEEDYEDRDELMRVIFFETLREIGLESGAEFYAAIRLKLSDGRRLLGEFNAVFQDDKQLAWQIPDKEVSYNNLMTPNPVYNVE